MADILISQLPANTPLLTDLLILANPTTGIAKKSTVTQLNNVLTLAGLSDVSQSPSNNSFLEYDGGNYNYVTNVVRATGLNVGIIPFLESIGPLNLSSSQLYQGAYGIEISEDQYLNNASVLFGLSSNSKGFLMPRLASTDRIDISLPPKGLEVFDSTLNIPYFYNGTAWKGVQEVLLSGTNIKTVNGNSILGSGNLTINGITTLNTLTASTQTFATSTTGTDFTISSATSTHTFNIPTASASARGLLSSSNWTTFNNKVGGSGTANYLSKFTASGTIGNSLIYDNGTSIDIGTVTSQNGEILRIGNGKSIQLENTSATIQSINFYNQALSTGNGYGMKFFYNSGIQTGSITQEWLSSSKFGIIFKNYPGSLQEAMRIDGNNNILINRTTDDGSGALLQVNGYAKIDTAFIGQVAGYGPGLSQFSHNARNGAGEYSLLSDGNGDTILNAKSGQNIYLRINNSNKLMLNSSGNVLIGTTTDTTRKLVVAGEQEWNNITFGTGAHTTSGNHLPIWVNGTKYWLALLNQIV